MAYLTSGKKKLLGSNTEGKGINIWQPNTEYKVNDLCLYKETNYYSLYICVTEHTSADAFVSAYWETIDGTEFEGYTKEEIEAMTDLILDTEVRIDKTYSSSKIYADIQQCLEDSKTYTLEEIARASTASYKVVTDVVDMTEEKYLYLLYDGITNYDIYIVETDGTPTKIGNTQIGLSNYYTKTEIDNDFLKKVDADGKYATITAVDGKANTTDLTNHTDNTDVHVTTADKTKWDKVTDKVDTTDLDSLITEINTLKTALNKKADTDKVVKKIYIRDTSSQDARTLIQNHWSEFDNFEFYNLHIDTAKWAWNAEIYAHTQEYGTVLLMSYGTDVPNVFYGKLYGGVWTWQEIGNACTTTVADVPKTTLTPVFPNGVTVASGGATINYIVRNGWCNVDFVFNISRASGLTWNDIATGLPKPANSVNIVLINNGGKTYQPIPIKINSTGSVSLRVPSEISATNLWTGNISYPVAE